MSSLYIQPLQMCTYTNMDVYLIKLRVESLFYDGRFVLGFLVDVWLEVPERERNVIPLRLSLVIVIQYCKYSDDYSNRLDEVK